MTITPPVTTSKEALFSPYCKKKQELFYIQNWYTYQCLLQILNEQDTPIINIQRLDLQQSLI